MESKRRTAYASVTSLDFTAHFNVPRSWAYLLGLRAAEAYCKTLPVPAGLAACVDRVVMERGCQIDRIKNAALAIPQKGALLITANHPTGILDGAVLLCALLSRRPDVRIVANDLLCCVPLLGELIIPIKKTSDGDLHGFSALMEVRRSWKRGECVVVFPAGTVAHWQWKSMAVLDAPWTTTLQDFADVLKVQEFRAALRLKNPIWFHVCAAFSRKARVALLLWAFLNNRSQLIDVVSFDQTAK